MDFLKGFGKKMSQRVFDPDVWGYVDASKTHGEGAEYYVGIGTEHWGYKDVKVLKIQMAYERKRSGRKAVSFPVEADDWERVCEMVRIVEEAYKSGKTGEVKIDTRLLRLEK